jgi:hypothetical protein
MLARLQQVITLSLLALALLWVAGCLNAGHPGWAAAGAATIFLGHALVLALEFVLLRWTHGADPAPRASVPQLIKAWIGEVLTAPRVFCWRQPFRHRRYPDHLPASARGRRGVLLVHGFVCNRGLWNPWMPRLLAHDVPCVAIDLEPVFGAIDHYAAHVEAGVRRLEAATGLPPVIVGHSMGGLAVRAWLRDSRGDRRVHRVITIGSPHHGTWLGRFGQTANTRQMQLHGPWIRALAAQEPPARYGRFICFYSHCDNIVFPPSTATLPGADNRHIAGWSHVHLAYHPEVFSEVLRWVAPALPSPAEAGLSGRIETR